MSKQLLKSSSLVSAMTMISRIVGFIRDMIIAHLFGATVGTDAFFVAFKLPNFMRRLFAEGAFSQAFVPIFAEIKTQQSEAVLKRFLSHIISNLALIVFVVCVLGMIFAPVLVQVFAPGFKVGGERFMLASHMLRLTFPYLFFIAITACLASVLNSYQRFAASAFTPVLLNISLIACAVIFYRLLGYPIYSLAIGVLVAGVLQFLFISYHVYKLGMLPRPQISFADPGVKRVLKLMVPALFGVSVAQINLFVDTFFASLLPHGGVSWLYYAERLMLFPLGVFAVAVSTVVLPHLSRKKAEADHQAYSRSIDWGLRFLLFIGVPAAVCLYFLSGPMLATLFNYGVFSAYDVRMSALALMAYAPGVPFFMLVKVLSTAFYANQTLKTPVMIGVVAMVANIVLNFLLIHSLAQAGIALATSIAGLLNALLLLVMLLYKRVYQVQPGWIFFIIRIALAAALTALFLWALTASTSVWLMQHAVWRLYHLIFLLFFAALIYLVVLLVLRFNFKKLLRSH